MSHNTVSKGLDADSKDKVGNQDVLHHLGDVNIELI